MPRKGHRGENVYSLIEEFKIISSKKEKLSYICRVIQEFRVDGSQGNPAHADEFLNVVLPFVESNLDSVCSDNDWIGALVGIITDHAASRHVENIKEYSYQYHDSYEKAIFVVLSMVETTQLLMSFMDALVKLELADSLIESLCTILIKDISYATQEIALDILCRMAMLCAQSPQTTYGVTFLRYLMKAMPESIQRALIDPEIGPQGLLINMRPSLNEINKENENVKSFPITAFGVEVARSVPYKRKIAGATWLDLSKEIFTMYIPEKDVMIKFSYQLITRVHFATASNTMQIGLEYLPRSIEGLMQSEEQALDGKPIFFYVEFGVREKQAMEGVRATFCTRLENAEARVLTDSLEKRKKYSIISSRDQTPEDVRIGLRRFHESRYPLVETSALQKTEISDTDIEENTREVKGGNEQQQHKKANVKVRSVVTAVKAKKPNELSLEKSNSQEDGCEGNLTDTEIDGFKMDDGGYLRHEVIKKVTLRRSAQAPLTASSSIAAAVIQPSFTIAKLENLEDNAASAISTTIDEERATTAHNANANDSVFERGSVFDPKEMEIVTLALANNDTTTKGAAYDILNTSEAVMARDDAPRKAAGKMNNKNIGVNRRSGGIVTNFAVATDQKDAKKRRKLSVTTVAKQDLSNILTPSVRTSHAAQKNYPCRSKYRSNSKDDTANKGVRSLLTVDENIDPRESSSQSTPLQSSRRRSYKARSSLATLTPPSMQISAPSITKILRRDSLLGVTGKIHLSNVNAVGKDEVLQKRSQHDSAILGIRAKDEIAGSNRETRIIGSNQLTARMRGSTTFAVSEEDEEPSKSQKHLIDSSKEIFTRPIKINEDSASMVDTTDTVFTDGDIEISNSPKHGIENEQKYTPISDTRRIEDSVAFAIKASSQMTHLDSTTTIASWRTSALLTNSFSPEPPSRRDDSIEKLNEKIKAIIQSPVSTQLDSDQGEGNKLKNREKSRVGGGVIEKSPELLTMLSSSPQSDNSKSQEGSHSNYTRSADRSEKTRKGRSRGREEVQDSSSEGDGPSSDEDGVIAMLLEELVIMQKARATRKRARLMMSAVDAASVQVQSYLKQWSDFIDSSLLELQTSMTLKLETLCASADSVCEVLMKESRCFDEETKETQAMALAIENEIDSLQIEIDAAAIMQREEEVILKNSINERRKSAVEGAKKSIEHVKRDRDRGTHSNRKNTKQLMLALRDM